MSDETPNTPDELLRRSVVQHYNVVAVTRCRECGYDPGPVRAGRWVVHLGDSLNAKCVPAGWEPTAERCVNCQMAAGEIEPCDT